MIHRRIVDWDDAYANGVNIPGGDRWPAAWIGPAAAYRESMSAAGRAKLDLAYGEVPRNRFDLFLPEGAPKGLVVYIHGGWWKAFDKSVWSHLAAGSVDSGYAVAMPSYTLCPEARIADITREVAKAVEAAAAMIEGPIMLTGHSAGGHLATRMVTTTSPLPASVVGRVRHVVSIAGLHDLRATMRIPMYSDLGIDEAEALAESPALLVPAEGTRLTCWVGGAERAEFVRQSALLANIWTGLGAATAEVVEPDRHHFTIVDGLADKDHPLTRALLSE
ncbi:alpha/beta hydrolase [Arvimicrobium flavum]|uniref:alpha/beta hydrolase n=1 Tax=Arvimicrobium flavum TaxID=3393320 RepID=UPI00237BC3F8|nr:alpha/beta hydrolase [Mesorhizobium shangrilense]